MNRAWVLFGMVATPGSALAGDVELWGGAAASGGVFGATESGTGSADSVTTQVELDGALGWGWGHVRVDLDAHFDLNALAGNATTTTTTTTTTTGGTGSPPLLAYPSPWPEWAVLQLGREMAHVRLGILNPNMGLEDWDPWVNYAPTYSNNFVYAGAGRFLGVEPSLTLDSGYDLFAFGGYDLDWESFGGGVGVATLQDAYSTWSGLAVYPAFSGDYCPDGDPCLYAIAVVALELYPADPVWVTLDTVTGLRDGGFFTSEQLVVNVIPEAIVNPFVRGELVFDPDGVLGAPDATASVGVRSDPTDWFRVALEGKGTFAGGTSDLGAWLVLAAHVPEPSPYSYQDPFGALEE